MSPEGSDKALQPRAWLSLLIGQLYIVARIVVRTQFAASQIALFQGRLAHAGYTAAPVPVWPTATNPLTMRPSPNMMIAMTSMKPPKANHLRCNP